MSDFAFNTEQQIKTFKSLEGLAGSIFNFGEEAYSKIDEAEASAQYKAGYEMLRKNTIDFNNSLATDPNPEQYVDKWNKAKDQYFKQATAMVKNPRALQALTDAWQNMDIQQYQTVSGIQTNARVENTVDTAISTSNKIAADNTRSNGDRKAAIRQLWTPIKAAGMRKPEVVDKYIEEMDKATDTTAMEEGLKQLTRAKGFDYALNQIDNPDFNQFFPSLTPDDRDAIGAKVEREYRFQFQQAKQKIHDSNSQIEDQFSHDLLEGRLTPQAIDKAELTNEPGGKSAGDIRKEWRQTLLSRGSGRQISNPKTLNNYLQWYYDPDVPHDADSVRAKLRQLNKDMGNLSEADYKSIGNDYLNLLANPNKSDATVKSETPEWQRMRKQYPGQMDAIDTQENYFYKWRSMNRDASDKEVQDKSKYFQDRVKSRALDSAIDDMFKAKRTTGGRLFGAGAHYGGEYESAMKNITNLWASSQAGDSKATQDIQELQGLQMLNFANKMGIGLSDFTYEFKGPYVVATVKATGKKYMADDTGQWKEVQ